MSNLITISILIILGVVILCLNIKAWRQLGKIEEKNKEIIARHDIWKEKVDEAEQFFNKIKAETERMKKELKENKNEKP